MREITEEARQPMVSISVTTKALIGRTPPSRIPQSNRGIVKSPITVRLATVGAKTACRALRTKGRRACRWS